MVSVAQEMNTTGINQGTAGNLSVRINQGMLITPSSVSYAQMSPNDLVALDFSGNYLKAQKQSAETSHQKPSSEWRLHADIFKQRPEINAVLHCHSTYATAIACHGKSIPSFHYMTAIAGGEDIRCAEYRTFGTTELSGNAVKALQGRYACLLEQHGQVSIATSLEKALQIAIEVETLAKIYLVSCQLGEPKKLDSDEMQKVLNKFQCLKYGHG